VDGEIVVERRRQWTPEEKAALMAEVEAEGGQVSVVAQRHGISKSLLYNWQAYHRYPMRQWGIVMFLRPYRFDHHRRPATKHQMASTRPKGHAP
jgi:hypothetical protein